MKKIITAINDSILNNELKEEENVEIICKDIQYKEGILEILENNSKVDYIIIDENLPGEIELINLIENILEKNEKIKIIITINKKNKNNLNLENKNIIKIFYENNFNLNKLKNYKNNSEKINNKLNKQNINKNKSDKINEENINKNELNQNNKLIKKLKIKNKLKRKLNIKNKLNKTKLNMNNRIITIFGERNVGKSIFSILIGLCLKMENKKILLIELNENNSNLYTILGCKKFNKLNNKKKINKKNKLKNNYKKMNEKYFNKTIERNIAEKLIIKINKNLDLLSYNKIINFNLIKKLEKKYNYLIIENYLNKNKIINKKIINYSKNNILLIKPNLIGIKNSKKIIDENRMKNNLKIIINNYNKYSIDEKILKKIFFESEIIGKVKSNIEFENFINRNFKIELNKNKSFMKEIKPIIQKII